MKIQRPLQIEISLHINTWNVGQWNLVEFYVPFLWEKRIKEKQETEQRELFLLMRTDNRKENEQLMSQWDVVPGSTFSKSQFDAMRRLWKVKVDSYPRNL